MKAPLRKQSPQSTFDKMFPLSSRRTSEEELSGSPEDQNALFVHRGYSLPSATHQEQAYTSPIWYTRGDLQ